MAEPIILKTAASGGRGRVPADANPPKRIGNLALIGRFALAYPGRIAAALLALLVSASATLAIPNGFRLIIDRGFSQSGGADIARWFQYLLVTVVIMSIATALRFYFVSWLGERVVADVRAAVQANLLKLSPAFFEENRPSEIASRLTADTSVIEQVVGTTVSVALRNIVLGIGGIVYLFSLAPRLTGLLLLGIPVIVLPIVFLGRRLRKLSRSSQDRIADVGAMVDEVLGAMKVVQAFGQEQRETERFTGAVEHAFGTAKRRITMRAFMVAIVITLVFGSITLVMWQGALDVASGRMSGGTIAAFVLTGGLVAGAFGALTEVYGDLLRGAGAAGRLGELIEERPGIASPADPVALPEPPEGRIGFSHVTFRYPTRPEVAALDDFSLDVAPGETVAVVGPSGAGKTTLFQLVQRFYDPTSGQVSVDGVALPLTNPAWTRARIAMVPQETVIFAASARDNLRYGRWTADDDQLWAAARAANAEEFLKKLPQGLDTFMGEGGARLSGGQRQRLAIARAILRDAPILLLDEATSALDAESERLVQDALDRLMENRTTIVIAHRLATVRAADRIVVMNDGRIVEEGKHDALSKAGGLYARLAALQFGAVVTTLALVLLAFVAGCTPGDASPPVAAPKATDGPTPDDFLTAVTPAVCDFVEKCRNDEVRAVMTLPVVLVLVFRTVQDHGYETEWNRTMGPLKAAGRWKATRAECNSEIPLFLKGFGITPAFLKSTLGKTLRYDRKRAASCLSAIKTPLPLCAESKKVADDPSIGDIETMGQAVGAPVGEHFADCEQVFEGLVDEGQPCHEDVECRGSRLANQGPLYCAKPADGTSKSKVCTPTGH